MSSSPMWSHFLKLHGRPKFNSSHWATYCKGCIQHEKELLQNTGTFDSVDWQQGGQSFVDACDRAGVVRGDKGPWVTHVLGGKGVEACPYASEAAKADARDLRDAEFAKKQKARAPDPAPSTPSALPVPPTNASASHKHGRSESGSAEVATKRMRQGVFEVFNGIDQPFSTAEAAAFQAQVLRATVSAGLAFRVWENPEVQKLFSMCRTTAPQHLPSRKVVGGRLLDAAAELVDQQISIALQGREAGLCSDGWKARQKIDVNAVCANVDYKVYALELTDITALNKDGPALCQFFADIIDRVQDKYKCIIIYFTTDADGGSKKGRVLLGKQRPYLFVPSCWAHQFQLILGDYFKVYPFGADISEKAVSLIAWINNHGKVRKIFDAVQAQLSKDRLDRVIVLAYVVANLTRWTTHCIAFLRLLVLKEYLQFAVLQSRGAIIAAQVGAAKSTEGERLKEEAVYFCTLISDSDFWNGLTSVVEDIEPICYGTNINQKDSTRADQVLLSLAGLYLHFVEHPEKELSVGLVARLEKRWKDCDQPLFLVALILNPFEGVSCFGPDAKFDHFKASALVTSLYRRVNDFPENVDSPEVRKAKERRVSTTMFEYLSGTGGFQGWEAARIEFEEDHGKDPIRVWTAIRASAPDLADFALTILKVVVNQAGCERVFSDVGNTESARRSRLGLAKLEKMTRPAQVNAGIRADHLAQGIMPANRQKRKNHQSVEKLLAVPRYRNLLEENDDEKNEGSRRSMTVSSAAGWRREMGRWIAETREAELQESLEEFDEWDDENSGIPPAPTASSSRAEPPKPRKWQTMTLKALFGGAKKPVRKFAEKEINAEAELMEALADAEEDARLDDGAVECDDDEVYVP
ncbi:ribonuclease H-like domain-containing protein [Favolaschia claudopus]|uniref:Ribonuclease H-like domain-containing protein n=1 Tax=Favolaschia claudopus TaxID=2862362 RepID=A0AAW0DWV3_9AGAR